MKGVFRLPLIPVFVAYTLGIYLGSFDLSLSSQRLILFLLILSGLWILLMIVKKPRWGSWTIAFFFFILGIFSIHLYLHPSHSPSHISRFIGVDRITVEGIVDRIPHRSQESTQLLIQSEKAIFPDRPLSVEGPLLLFLKDDAGAFRVGDRLRFISRLHSPRGFRNPGSFSYERHLAFEQVHTIGFLLAKNGWVKIGEEFSNPLLLQMERWRDHLRHFLQKHSQLPCSGIFEALVLGEQGNIPEKVKEHFILTGTAHLLAISGDQFGIVALLSFSLLIWILKRSEYLLLTLSVKKWAAGLTIPCIIFYAFIAGGGISVIRAMIMVLIFLISILLDRERNLLHTLALAAFLILMVSPPSLFDVSFQLSFLAVFSILYMVPRILKRLKGAEPLFPTELSWKQRALNYLKLSLLVSGVAILGTAPFVTLHFNRISPIGLITNLFVIPWVGFLIVPLALIASLFSFLSHPLAVLLIHINQFITLILLKVIAFFSSLPFASFFVSTPTALEIVLFYFLLFSAVHLRKTGKVRYLWIGFCFVLVLDLAYWNLKDRFRRDLTLTFLDVGHGDSILVEYPKGRRMLIDGGGSYDDRFDMGKNVIAPFLWNQKIRGIDYLVLTHPDPDHLKGLDFIASHFRIGQFWSMGLRTGSESHLHLEKTLEKRKIESFVLNDRIPPLEVEGVRVSFLNPPKIAEIDRVSHDRNLINNSSLVMRIQFRNVSFLLGADIGQDAEYRMMREGYLIKSDLLKIPHHGSASSSSTAFLERVKPIYAILSVGERNIGHLPNPEVMRRYRQIGSKIFRTDRHGAITVITDGKEIEVKTFAKSKN
ncbi:MAG TPA: DNA internalization-related competence protein ComEC/Rec2 [Thermodesulfobacteriota bacterium]|nr:DNA internalization-related competence protein ComEC/Rec2 [Thermodesulfobacteriota bacterium]